MFATLNEVNLMKLKTQLGERERDWQPAKNKILLYFTLHNTFIKMPLAAFCSLFSSFQKLPFTIFLLVCKALENMIL